MTREQIITTARQYIGTPWQHQARLKGVGVDCTGLVVCVARDLGVTLHDRRAYGRRAEADPVLLRYLDGQCRRVDRPQLGDIMVFWWNQNTRRPQHVGIRTDVGIIHAYALARSVCEHTIDKEMMHKFICAYEFPGVEA